MRTKKKKLEQRFNKERTGKQINDGVQQTGALLAAEGGSVHFVKSAILPRYATIAAKYCKAAELEAISQCNTILIAVQSSTMPEALSPSVEDLPKINIEAFPCEKLEETKWLGLANKMYNPAEISTHLEEVFRCWREEIEARSEGWARQLFTDHFQNFCEKRRELFHAHFQKAKKEFDTAVAPQELALAVTENLVRELRADIGKLEIPLGNALASVK